MTWASLFPLSLIYVSVFSCSAPHSRQELIPCWDFLLPSGTFPPSAFVSPDSQPDWPFFSLFCFNSFHPFHHLFSLPSSISPGAQTARACKHVTRGARHGRVWYLCVCAHGNVCESQDSFTVWVLWLFSLWINKHKERCPTIPPRVSSQQTRTGLPQRVYLTQFLAALWSPELLLCVTGLAFIYCPFPLQMTGHRRGLKPVAVIPAGIHGKEWKGGHCLDQYANSTHLFFISHPDHSLSSPSLLPHPSPLSQFQSFYSFSSFCHSANLLPPH